MSDQQPKMRICAQKVAEVFDGDKTYQVPIFQRDYVWKEPQWEDLWDDAVPEREHYIGALVLQRMSDDESFEIIDGQQRLVTISLLASAAIQVLCADFKTDEAKRCAEKIKSMFIVNSDGNGKLVPWGETRRFWTNKIVGRSGLMPGEETPQIRRMKNARDFFIRCLRRKESEKRILDTPAAIHGFLTHAVGDCMICSRVVTADESNAHAVFATLNGKGRALSPTALILNYFLSQADDANEEMKIRRQWDHIIRTVNGEDEMINFVRAFYNYRYGFSSRSGLYREIVRLVRDGKDMRNFMESMLMQAAFYNQLRRPASGYWIDDYDKADVLRMLRVQRCYPLLMSVQESLAGALSDVLHICVAISIRREICGQDTRIMERIYHRVARAVHKKDLRSSQDIFDSLQKGAYPSDPQFREQFSLYKADINMSRAGAPKLRYLLETIEVHLGNEDVDLMHLRRFDEWGGDTADSHRLGNHVFWESDGIPSPETLADSSYQTTRMLGESLRKNGKTPEAIKRHQEKLARIAALEIGNWRFDFSQEQDDEEE